MSVITIARPFGAGGRTVGHRVAKKLNYTLIDEQMVNAVAEKANVSRQWVQSVEQELGNKLLNFVSGLVSTNFVERLLADDYGYLDEKIYTDVLAEVMAEIAREDRAVIIGRGGQYFLHDHPDAFHVLLIADTTSRIQFIQNHYGLDQGAAAQVIKRGDKRRNNFYKQIRHNDYDDPILYHLVVNMAWVSLDKAEELICDFIKK